MRGDDVIMESIFDKWGLVHAAVESGMIGIVFGEEKLRVDSPLFGTNFTTGRCGYRWRGR